METKQSQGMIRRKKHNGVKMRSSKLKCPGNKKLLKYQRKVLNLDILLYKA
jgi:hypothetical protein